ncbi:MAG: cob(I)yrinic acid a,c-diamide adenosyltransferase [Thermoproteota archaeon]|nr:cob(I)yrinic acid a,c-diamide adenosyltransferase [Thermoproteota archaeon]
MKIYTKTGDKGETRLIGGKQINKADLRIAAYGEIDELNSSIGLAISFLRSKQDVLSDLADIIAQVQNDLFVLGSDLADPSWPQDNGKTPRTNEKMSSNLESIIDKFESELESITFFILPGGSIEASFLHLSRGVARRAERAVVLLSKSQPINPAIMIYLNRLSDLLFVMARLANKRLGVQDIPWRM